MRSSTLKKIPWQRKRPWVYPTQNFSQSALTTALPVMSHQFFVWRRGKWRRLFKAPYPKLLRARSLPGGSTVLTPLSPPPYPQTSEPTGRIRDGIIKVEQNLRLCVVAGWGFLTPSPLLSFLPRAPSQPFLGGSLVKWRKVTVSS